MNPQESRYLAGIEFRRVVAAHILQESDTGLAPPHLWDIAADRQRMSEDHPLQVARCTKIIQDEKDSEKIKYVINVKQIAKFVVKLGERISPTDIEEGMRVGYVLQSFCGLEIS